MKSLKYAERINDSVVITGACLNLSYIYQDQKEYNLQEGILQKALKYATTDFQLERIYNNFSEIYSVQKKQDKALYFLRKALVYAQRADDKMMNSSILSNIGVMHLEKSAIDSAYIYFKKVIEQPPGYVDNYILAQTYKHLAYVEEERGNLDIAKSYMDNSLQMASRFKLRRVLAEDYEWYSTWYKKKGNFKKAYEYKVKSTLLNDSLFNEAKSKQIKELEAIYQTEKKQAEITRLNSYNKLLNAKNRTRTILLLTLVLLFFAAVLMGIIIFRNHRLNAKRRESELNYRLLRVQMNPHFMFNSLVAIQSFLSGGYFDKAKTYISKFSRLTRLVLENSKTNLIPVEDEVETLQLYLELQKMRFSDSFTSSITLPENPEFLNLYIPPMIAQPFVENAIEHGFLRGEKGGAITIQYSEENNYVYCTIEDNGIGINQSKNNAVKDEKHKSLALEITKERLELLSKELKREASFVVKDLSEKGKQGTAVTIKIPV